MQVKSNAEQDYQPCWQYSISNILLTSTGYWLPSSGRCHRIPSDVANGEHSVPSINQNHLDVVWFYI